MKPLLVGANLSLDLFEIDKFERNETIDPGILKFWACRHLFFISSSADDAYVLAVIAISEL